MPAWNDTAPSNSTNEYSNDLAQLQLHWTVPLEDVKSMRHYQILGEADKFQTVSLSWRKMKRGWSLVDLGRDSSEQNCFFTKAEVGGNADL